MASARIDDSYLTAEKVPHPHPRPALTRRCGFVHFAHRRGPLYLTAAGCPRRGLPSSCCRRDSPRFALSGAQSTLTSLVSRRVVDENSFVPLFFFLSSSSSPSSASLYSCFLRVERARNCSLDSPAARNGLRDRCTMHRGNTGPFVQCRHVRVLSLSFCPPTVAVLVSPSLSCS